jgi:hypothetical protein
MDATNRNTSESSRKNVLQDFPSLQTSQTSEHKQYQLSHATYEELKIPMNVLYFLLY